METHPCNFCESEDRTFVHALRDVRKGLPGEFILVRCTNCGLLYLHPRPSWKDLEPQYAQDYHCFVKAVEDQPSPFVRWAQSYGLRRRRRAILQRQDHGRLLDIGSGTGNFLNEMQNQPGWQVVGVEPAPTAADYARRRFGLQVFTDDVIEASFTSASFNIVTLWDVLEHIPNPKACLVEIYRLLMPGGWVVIKAPNPASGEARLFGPDWVGYEAPQHLYGYPPATLIKKLTEIGFHPVETEQMGGDYATFMTSLGLWLERRRRIRLGLLAKSLGRSTTMRVISAPFFWLIRKGGLTSSVVYFARKPVQT